jgi:hypothetical protein
LVGSGCAVTPTRYGHVQLSCAHAVCVCPGWRARPGVISPVGVCSRPWPPVPVALSTSLRIRGGRAHPHSIPASPWPLGPACRALSFVDPAGRRLSQSRHHMVCRLAREEEDAGSRLGPHGCERRSVRHADQLLFPPGRCCRRRHLAYVLVISPIALVTKVVWTSERRRNWYDLSCMCQSKLANILNLVQAHLARSSYPCSRRSLSHLRGCTSLCGTRAKPSIDLV